MLRRIAWIVAALIGLLAAALLAAYLFIGRFDLGPLAARRASAMLGRTVTFGALHVTPGRWITVDLADARVANIPSGSRPSMVTLRHLTAEVAAMSVLHGPALIRRLTIDGLSVLVERTPAHLPNWRFGAPKTKAPPDRSWFPTLLDARLDDSDIIYRTARGTEYRTRLDQVAIQTTGADQPVHLSAVGAYDTTPIRLEAALQPIAVLRDAAVPYGMDLHFTSGATTLDFKGSMTAPLDANGEKGSLTLVSPDPAAIPAIAAMGSGVRVPLRLSGIFVRKDDTWHLTNLRGALAGNAITAGSLGLTEGERGAPDSVGIDLAFDRLDLKSLSKTANGAPPGGDISLAVDRAPDPLIKASLTVRQLTYGTIRAADMSLAAAVTPGLITVKTLSMTYLGAQARASARAEPAGNGGRVSADISLSGADIGQLRGALGIGPVPMNGKLNAQAAMNATGTTLNTALRTAGGSAVVSMTGGAIAHSVVEMASTNVLALVRKNKGMSAVSCLLAVLDMRAGTGTIAPLRIRTANGTLAGNATFNLAQKRFDLTIGGQGKSTGFLALDIPMHVSGTFDRFTVRPAAWTKAGRALLATRVDLNRLPPALRRAAQGNACLVP